MDAPSRPSFVLSALRSRAPAARVRAAPCPATALRALAAAALAVPLTAASRPALLGGSDHCTQAASNDAIGGQGTFQVSTFGATTGSPLPSCPSMGSDVWFYWTADASGTATISTCGQVTADSMIAVWADSGPFTCPTTQVACNDDLCGLQTQVSFPVSPGASFYLQVGGFGGVQYSGTFTISIGGGGPSGDDCNAALAISGPGPFPFDTSTATTGMQGQANANCNLDGSTAFQRDLWYSWTAPSSGWMAVSTCSSTLDLRVAVYFGTGCPGSLPAVCDEDGCGAPDGAAHAPFLASAGNTYTIQLGMRAGATAGSGSFTIGPFAPGPGDDCAAPIVIAGLGNFGWDSTAATTGTQGQNNPLCAPTAQITYDVWYRWTCPCTGAVTVSMCGLSAVDTMIAVWNGSACPAGAGLACNDDFCVANGPSQVTFNAVAGQDYMLQVGVWPGETAGTGTLAISGGCPPSTAGGFEIAGTAGGGYALTAFDDGTGTRLYAAGEFDAAGAAVASNVARWNGAAGTWSPLGSGTDGRCAALAAFDEDAGGPQPARLFAGGAFENAGGAPAAYVARWNGASWSPVGSGFDDWVSTLLVFDADAGGPGLPALHAGGLFTQAGATVVNSIARWNGSVWQPLGTGVNAPVTCLATFDTDAGGPNPPELYAGGFFTIAGGVPANGIARWNGTTWQAVGSGVSGAIGRPVVHALAVFDEDAGGPDPARLFLGGQFTHAGGNQVNGIARWNGSTYSALGTGISVSGAFATVRALGVFNEGPGARLYAAGSFRTAGSATTGSDPNNPTPLLAAARWDGATWTALGAGTERNANGVGRALAFFDHDGNGTPSVLLSGFFTAIGPRTVAGVAAWNGTTWQPFGPGSGMGGNTVALASSGTLGAPLYAGGSFLTAGLVPANRVAEWTESSSSWSALGAGLDDTVRALEVSGDDLYAGGDFERSGATPVAHVARWNGSVWSALGSGTDGPVHVLKRSGTAIVAGGEFQTAGGVVVGNIASWNGSVWSALGGGTDDAVRALELYDEGGGPMLIAGGSFTRAGSVTANGVARWNGSSWSSIGGGVCCNGVYDLAVFDAGTGPRLYAAGEFDLNGDGRPTGVARWNAGLQVWEDLGGGFVGGQPSRVSALSRWSTSAGPRLAAGGSFRFTDGVAANNITLFNGSSWAAIGNGTDGPVLALQTLAVAGSEVLFLAGEFKVADLKPSARVARVQ